MEFIVDRLESGAILGSADLWRCAETLRSLWADGHDPIRIVMDEARRAGMDFWRQLRMNDWHHVDAEGKVYRLIGSRFYEERPEYLIGEEGVAGWPQSLQNDLRYFQDVAHAEVRRLRFDVPQWIEAHLVDIVVPSTFFAQDTEENVSEWVELAGDGPVRINPAIEEAYLTGATQGHDIAEFQIKTALMQPLTVEMIRALAARHWAAGANGLSLFDYPNTTATYCYDNFPAIDDIGTASNLEYKDKCYAVMRRNSSFPNCFPQERQIPAALGDQDLTVALICR